jgi:uncharacterized protein YndB with AHSA1/START domain
MEKNLIAKATTAIHAPIVRVWEALTNPQDIQQYMFGTTVVSDWKKGSPILWKGEWQGKQYEDKGQILDIAPQELLRYSHYSPLSSLADVPENYHTVTIRISGENDHTRVNLEQDHNSSEEEQEHSAKNWEMMLSSMKPYLEGK